MIENEIDPVVKSRFEKTLIRCPMCDTPIGQRCGDKWWFEKNDRGKKGRVLLTQQQKTPQGDYKMTCPDPECEGGHIFAWVNERFSVDKGLTNIRVEG